MLESIITSEWLNENLNRSDLVVLDASPKDNKAGLKTELANIRIKGALFFDLKNSFGDSQSDLPSMLPDSVVFEKECQNLGINRSSQIVVYDNLGIYTSPRVRWMFRVMGHHEVAVLDGGLSDWISKGFETESVEKIHISPGNFKARFDSKFVRGLEDIQHNLLSKKELIIDARSNKRFLGEAPEPRKELKSGHIPNSINIPFSEVLHEGKYKSLEELTDIFRIILSKDEPLIFMCGSGVTACIVLLACEMVMQNPTSIFDGSWTAWASVENLPIESQS